MVSTIVGASHHFCLLKIWQITLLPDDVVDEVPVFKSYVHSSAIVDLFVSQIGVGTDRLFFFCGGRWIAVLCKHVIGYLSGYVLFHL